MGKIFSCLFPKKSQKYKQSHPINDHLEVNNQVPQELIIDCYKDKEQPSLNKNIQYDIPVRVEIQVKIVTNDENRIVMSESSESDDEIQSLNEIDTQQYKSIKWVEGELIGQGSFGLVKMGMNSKTGQMMAVKQVFLKNLTMKAVNDKVESLEQEIYFLTRLKHENIVQYLGMERTKDSINIFLEYISGGSLQTQLGKFGKFKETLIKVYLRQILQGLNYLHSKKVIHRDIKGGNILVDNYGTIRLADFGSSKKLNEMVNAENYGTLCGTPNFMAPEVVNQQKYGRKADIWSLGCTIIEMATGRPPWSEYNNPIAVMIRIAKADRPPEFPSHLSQEAKSFLEVCFKFNPQERWSVKKLIRHPFVKKQQINIQRQRNKGTILKVILKNQKIDDSTPSILAQPEKVSTNISHRRQFAPSSFEKEPQSLKMDLNQGLSPKFKKNHQDKQDNHEIDNQYAQEEVIEQFCNYNLNQTNIIKVRKQSLHREKNYMIEIEPKNRDEELYFTSLAPQTSQNNQIPKAFLDMMISNPQDDVSPRSKSDTLTLGKQLDDILNEFYQEVLEEKQISPPVCQEKQLTHDIDVVVVDENLEDQLGKIVDYHYKGSNPPMMAQQLMNQSPREQQVILQDNINSLQELLLKQQIQEAREQKDISPTDVQYD